MRFGPVVVSVFVTVGSGVRANERGVLGSLSLTGRMLAEHFSVLVDLVVANHGNS
jgi:hypothetical protein